MGSQKKIIAISPLVLFMFFVSSVVYSGGGIELLMERAGLSEDEVEWAMSTPHDLVMSEDYEKILPSQFIFFTPGGDKAVVFVMPDTIEGRVLYDLSKRYRINRNGKKK